MGCGSSRGSVVPLEPLEPRPPANGTARRLPGSGQSRGASRRASAAIQGSDPPEEDLPKELPELRELVKAAGGKAMAFEVPFSDDEPRLLGTLDGEQGCGPGGGAGGGPGGGPRRPPRRLQRLEDAPLPPSQRLTHRVLDERQEAADERRSQILSQRVQSAQQRLPKRRGRRQDSDGGDGDASSYGDSLGDSTDSRLSKGELLETLRYEKQFRNA